MRYEVTYTEKADADIAFQKKNNPKAYEKILKFIKELHDHPRSGTGHPEPLKGGNNIRWSRRINDKDRLEYDVYDEIVVVSVVSAVGHYGNK